MDGMRAVTSETALGLELATGASLGFWLNSQAAWDAWNRMKGPSPDSYQSGATSR